MDHYLIGIGDGSGMEQVRPAWPAREMRRVTKTEIRTAGSGLFTYNWEVHFEARLPLTRVDSGLGHRLNRWWADQSRLAFIRVGEQGFSTQAVRIVNPHQPISRRDLAADDLYSGVLALAATAPGDMVEGAPLILDHARFGTLDTYNILL